MAFNMVLNPEYKSSFNGLTEPSDYVARPPEPNTWFTRYADDLIKRSSSPLNINTGFDSSGLVDIGDGNLSQMSALNAGSKPSFFEGMMGTKDTPGWGMPALGLLQSGLGFYLGKKQLDLGKNQLRTQKQQFSDQFNLQKEQINQDIYSKGRSLYGMNPERNMTPEEYYEKNKL
jgi:hypothetical protein